MSGNSKLYAALKHAARNSCIGVQNHDSDDGLFAFLKALFGSAFQTLDPFETISKNKSSENCWNFSA
jgi:hypothetical protein